MFLPFDGIFSAIVSANSFCYELEVKDVLRYNYHMLDSISNNSRTGIKRDRDYIWFPLLS